MTHANEPAATAKVHSMRRDPAIELSRQVQQPLLHSVSLSTFTTLELALFDMMLMTAICAAFMAALRILKLEWSLVRQESVGLAIIGGFALLAHCQYEGSDRSGTPWTKRLARSAAR